MMPTINSFTAVALGNSLAVQWLRLQAFTAGDVGSVPDRETMILHPELCSQKKKRKKKHYKGFVKRVCYYSHLTDGETRDGKIKAFAQGLRTRRTELGFSVQ